MEPYAFGDKRVYVVGGSLGIGLSIAQRMAAQGGHVTIFARRPEPLERAVATINAARQPPAAAAAACQLDVTEPLQVTEVMTHTVAERGVPDVLINCAGHAHPRRFEDISYEQFADTLRVNLHGCWNTVRALLPYMKARGGYVVNTSSIAGLIGVYGYTDYCASKFALVGFSEALRSELTAYGITVSVLCPPDTDTPGLAIENETKPAETQAITATARVMSPEAVAEALVRGMTRRRFLIIPGTDGRLIVLGKRLFPGLVARVIDRTVRRVKRGVGRAR